MSTQGLKHSCDSFGSQEMIHISTFLVFLWCSFCTGDQILSTKSSRYGLAKSPFFLFSFSFLLFFPFLFFFRRGRVAGSHVRRTTLAEVAYRLRDESEFPFCGRG
jgi:hypothetical protein